MKYCVFITYFAVCILFISCSSGEYDLDTVTIDNVKKIVSVDTVSFEDENIGTDNNIRNRDKYRFIVQIGAFFMQDNFERFLTEAKQKVGPEVYYVQSNDLYKIRVGEFLTKPDADAFLLSIKNMGYPDAFVLTIKNPNLK